MAQDKAKPIVQSTSIPNRQDLDAGKEARMSIDLESNNTIVDWESDDLDDPLNWTSKRKLFAMGLVASMALVGSLGSSILAPGVPLLMKEFESDNQELAIFVVSIYILGFAIGPLILSPLSEIYGRAIVFNVTNLLFIVFAIGCAVSPSLSVLIGLRFLMGFAGSAPTAVGAGAIVDMFKPQDRGKATSLYAIGPLVGPAIGPLIGGYLAQSKGWRWVPCSTAILSGFLAALTLMFFREPCRPVLLNRKVKRLRYETGNSELRSKLDYGLSSKQIIRNALIRPIKLLLFSPIVILTCVAVAIMFGYLYLLITTFPTVFDKQYGFSTRVVGSSYLGIGGGNIIGLVLFANISDRYLKRKQKLGEMKPEYRLITVVFGGPLVALGLFCYGWSAQAQVHWIVPILSTGLFGMGFMTFMMPISTYLIDSFTIYAASATSANILLRSIFGAVLPLIADRLYSRLGLGWGNSLLAFIALSTCPLPWLFHKYGERLRLNYPVKL